MPYTHLLLRCSSPCPIYIDGARSSATARPNTHILFLAIFFVLRLDLELDREQLESGRVAARVDRSEPRRTKSGHGHGALLLLRSSVLPPHGGTDAPRLHHPSARHHQILRLQCTSSSLALIHVLASYSIAYGTLAYTCMQHARVRLDWAIQFLNASSSILLLPS